MSGSPQEDPIARLERRHGRFDPASYRRLAGAANPFKEGDRIVGVAAADEAERARAREGLGRTRVGDLAARPFFEDSLYDLIRADAEPHRDPALERLTLAQLRARVLTGDPGELRPALRGLPSDVFACLVKLMPDEELTALGDRWRTPLAGTHIGAKGYLGARVQPNSPTDHPVDILWQVLSAWSFTVGDVLLGTNPVSGDPSSVAAVEAALRDPILAFGLEDVLPHCVLAHIDLQAELEARDPGTTGIWFQSLGGSTALNRTFGVDLPRLIGLADQRTGPYGFYFETGQGADFTNGHAQGTDMVVHEARKYGLIRLLQDRVARARCGAAPWVHVNDVAGFIGPEVFRTREQLVRCCLEDLAMAKLHGLTMGLDICATLHMDLTLDDLEWCQDRLAPAGPAYLMALPTRNDPMLGYLTTSFQDHLRLRRRFGLRVQDPMWAFFRRLGVVDDAGRPTARFGRPLEVWVAYRRAKGDRRTREALLEEGRRQMAEVRARGVPLAEGHGREVWEAPVEADREVRERFRDAHACVRADFTEAFLEAQGGLRLATLSADRQDFLLHPARGETLAPASLARLAGLDAGDAAVLVSDGLNAHALMDPGHLDRFLPALRQELARAGLRVPEPLLLLERGRVRAGYRLGEALYGALPEGSGPRGVIHVLGERPGGPHRAFSVYVTGAPASAWRRPGAVDHPRTRVVSGIADTALAPGAAAREAVALLVQLLREPGAEEGGELGSAG